MIELYYFFAKYYKKIILFKFIIQITYLKNTKKFENE